MTTISIDGLNTVINNLEEGIMFLDKDRSVVAINHAALDMVGHHNEQLIGSMCMSLFQGTECGRYCTQKGYCSLLDLDKEKKVHDLDLLRPDDTMISLRMWAIPLPGEHPAACAVILRNRTRERQLEEEVSNRLRLGE